MSAARLFIGMITFYILAQVVCNIGEGQQMVAGVGSDMTYMTQYSQTKSTDTAGNTADFWNIGANTLGVIGKVVTFDYSIFYDVDPVTGVKTANDFTLFRYILIAIGIVMVIDMVIVLRQVISK